MNVVEGNGPFTCKKDYIVAKKVEPTSTGIETYQFAFKDENGEYSEFQRFYCSENVSSFLDTHQSSIPNYPIFSTLAKGICNEKHMMRNFPILEFIVRLCLFEINSLNSESLKALKEKKVISVASLDEVVRAFYQALNHFNETNDPSKINLILENCEKYCLQKKLLETIRKILETKDIELLGKPTLFFMDNGEELSLKNRFRFSVKNNQYLLLALKNFVKVFEYELSKNLEGFVQRTGKTSDFLQASKDMKFNSKNLFVEALRNSDFSLVHKRIICTVALRIMKNGGYLRSIINLSLLIKSDLEHYSKVMFSEEGEKIGGQSRFVEKYGDVDAIPYDPYFVQKHLNLFENFLPRVKEVFEEIAYYKQKLRDVFVIPLNFILYFHTSRVNRLKERLSAGRTESIEEIILDELSIFEKEMKTDGELVRELLTVLRSNKELADYRFHMQSANSLYSNTCEIGEAILKGPLEMVEQTQNDLFILPENERLLMIPSIHKPSSLQLTPSKKGEDENNTEKGYEKETEQGCFVGVADVPVPFSVTQEVPIPLEKEIPEILQKCREVMLKDLKVIEGKYNGFGSKSAVVNAQNHFDDLICVLNRFYFQSKKTVLRGQLFSFVLDCVRHCSLLTEQLLTAFNCESNKVKTPEELKEYIKHDLYHLLLLCKSGNSLSGVDRNWIRTINFGEMLVRDVSQWSFKNSFVSRLLIKTKSFAEGGKINPQLILNETLDYLQNTLTLCSHIRDQTNNTLSLHSQGSRNKVNDAYQMLAKNCSLLGRGLSEVKITKQSVSENLIFDSIEKDLRTIQKESCDLYNFKNVFGIFLPHLRAEMDLHETIQPSETHVHLGNVLLINQMLLEEILLQFIDPLEVPKDENRHNLLKLVETLGMNPDKFTKEELVFLRTGKDIRQIVRYPASYKMRIVRNKKASIVDASSAFNAAKNVARSENFHRRYDFEGFTIANSKVASQYRRVKEYAFKDVQLVSEIIKKVLSYIYGNKECFFD